MDADDDPYGWIIDECKMSSSEESELQHCPYFGVPDSDYSDSDEGDRNPADVPFEIDGITMLSPPASPGDELPNQQTTVAEDQEIYHTPPEFRSTPTSSDNYSDARMVGSSLDRETLPIDVDSESVVELWRDTDLGFMEVESEENRVPEKGSSPIGTLEMSDTVALSESLRNVTPSPGGTLALATESDNGEVNTGGNQNVAGDIDQVQCISEIGSSSRAFEVKTKGKRVLPSWGNPGVEDDHENADEELVADKILPDDKRVGEELVANERVGDAERVNEEPKERTDHGPEVLPSLVNGSEPVHSDIGTNPVRRKRRRGALLNLLRQLARKTEEDTSLYSLSLLEVAEQRWGKFGSSY